MKKFIFIVILLAAFLPSAYAERLAVNPSEQCQTLTCVRNNIDSINDQLVRLIAKRLSYVKRAGELKAGKLPAYDSTREAVILKNVGIQAEELGYSADIAQTIFKTILEQSRQYEIISNGKILRVGTTGDYPPLSYYDAKARKFVGTDIARALDLGQYLGRKIEFVKTTWSSLSADLSSGKFDIAMGGISDTPDRREKFLLSSPIFLDGKIPLTLCSSISKYNLLLKINQPQVRVVENMGGTNEQFAKQFLPKAKLILVKDNSTVFNYLFTNQADVMITDKTEAVYRQIAMPGLCAVNPENLLTKFHKVYLLAKNNPQLLTQVNAWLAGLKH